MTNSAFLQKTSVFLYKTCHGAFVVFIVVSAVSIALQFLNNALSDVIAWPKNAHLTLLFILLLNIPVAMGVSLYHRKWKTAITQCLLSGAALFVYAILVFTVLCVPTRQSAPPNEQWTERTVCQPAHLERSRLKYLGGISQREPILVFEIMGEEPVDDPFRPGSSYGEGDWVRRHFQSIMDRCRLSVSLPSDMAMYYCPCDGGSLHLLMANGKRLLVYEGF